MTTNQACLKNNEGDVHHNFLDKRMKVKPKFQVKDLVRTADLKKNFSKGDTTNWSYKMYKRTKIFNDTLPSYHIDNLPQRYNVTFLKTTKLTMQENKDIMKILNIN